MTRGASIGTMHTRLLLQAPVDTPDDTGAFDRTWSTVTPVWGHVVPLSGEQRVAGDAIEVSITHRVTTRRRPEIANGLRFILGDRALLIRSVTDADDRRSMLLCRCEEIAP